MYFDNYGNASESRRVDPLQLSINGRSIHQKQECRLRFENLLLGLFFWPFFLWFRNCSKEGDAYAVSVKQTSFTMRTNSTAKTCVWVRAVISCSALCVEYSRFCIAESYQSMSVKRRMKPVLLFRRSFESPVTIE